MHSMSEGIFLRGRNMDYVRAARALGLSDLQIMVRHLLPNALVSTITFMPFILSGSVTTLTALDFLGFGLPPGSASLGELVKQGKTNAEVLAAHPTADYDARVPDSKTTADRFVNQLYAELKAGKN